MSDKISVEQLAEQAKAVREHRGKQRDTPEGERSMDKTVNIFNARYGTNLTAEMGWQFQADLKSVRDMTGDFDPDNYIDGSNYILLKGEAASERDG